MIKNYLTVALRFLAAHRLYAVLNIAGLAVGLAAATMIAMFVADEVSYDRWIPDAERIYRVHTTWNIPGRAPLVTVAASGMAKAALEKDFPEIESAARMFVARPTLTRGGDTFFEAVALADPNFFAVLAIPFVAGERATALAKPGSVVISESIAKKYFGAAPALGQVISGRFRWGERELRVTGVFKDLPSNTHLQLDMVAPINAEDVHDQPYILESWTSVNTMTYLKLRPGADAAKINAALPKFEEQIPNESMGGQEFKVADYVVMSIMNLRDLHLRSRGLGEQKPPGDGVAVATFSAVAVLILIIAGINFTNLATARASQRAREVTLRKVVGATQRQLIMQFLGESVLMAMAAALVALGLIAAALPGYNLMLGKALSLSWTGGDGVIPALLALAVLAGLGAGAYPAFVLSRFEPARTLKANKSAATEGSGRLRAALVVTQFAISIGLIVCTAVVYGQTLYVKTMDVGFDASGVLAVDRIRSEAARAMSDTYKDRLSRVLGVVAVTRSDTAPADEDENNTIIQIPGQISAQPIVVGQTSVDYDFFSTMGIRILAGRALSEEFGADDATFEAKDLTGRNTNIVINRRAMELLGITEPAAAVRREFRIGNGEGDGDDSMAPVTVVGVVENANFASARKDIRSMMYFHDKRRFAYVLARARNVDPAMMRDEAARLWRELVPTQPFTAQFVTDAMAAQYAEDEGRGRMFAAFAALAILIACLGLYGLAAFTAERRTKEIGIRKVLGAGTAAVVRLLAWDFAKPVLIANAIAWPAAWFLMQDWLAGFQQRIEMGPGYFVAAGGAALVIALATVGGHAVKVARANAIHALRYE